MRLTLHPIFTQLHVDQPTIMSPELTLKALLGKTLTSCEGAKVGGTDIVFDSADGKRFHMYHQQDCCEGVSIDRVEGDIQTIIGSPILTALESVTNDPPEDADKNEWRESATWTEFTITTAKGEVKIRWLGESNGYYGEGVDFNDVTPDAGEHTP